VSATRPGRYADAPAGSPTTLTAATCGDCGRVSFPVTDRCPACTGELIPTALAGPARLSVLTAVLAQPPGALIEAPYDVGVADFDEGIRIIGLVDGSTEQGDLVVPVVVAPHPEVETFAFRRVAAGHPAEAG
jgi:uncharacterized OB-fold protein